MNLEKTINQFIEATNALDVDAAMLLFADNAIIDDVSVGDKFIGRKGVREYLEKFFVGYHTNSKLESIEIIDDHTANVKVDFTGDFGHETGGLDITLNAKGLIEKVGAYLD